MGGEKEENDVWNVLHKMWVMVDDTLNGQEKMTSKKRQQTLVINNNEHHP